MSTIDHWPLSGLQIHTPTLELRVPNLTDLAELAQVAADGIHDAAVQPFSTAWTDCEPAARARSVLQYHWSTWATWSPQRWRLELVVIVGGQVVGSQSLGADNFATVGQVVTGSWLGQQFQGRGIGRRMRAAILHFAFAGLGAHDAISTAHEDNPASLSVSRSLGYAENGIERRAVGGKPVTGQRLRLTRTQWDSVSRPEPVELSDIQPSLHFFGIDQPPRHPAIS